MPVSHCDCVWPCGRGCGQCGARWLSPARAETRPPGQTLSESETDSVRCGFPQVSEAHCSHCHNASAHCSERRGSVVVSTSAWPRSRVRYPDQGQACYHLSFIYIRCKNLALNLFISVSFGDTWLKSVGPFYLVSMPGEVKYPTQGVNISLNNWFRLLSIQFTNTLCESWTHGIVAHTFDIRLQLKLFKFPVNYFFEEFICETSRSDGVFSHKWTSRYTNLNFSSSNMHKWN